MLASYDGYKYMINDKIFFDSINAGNSEPYPIDLAIVKQYFAMFPHKNRTYIDVGAHIGTTIMPYTKMFANIIGYEANPANFELLKKNIEINNINNCKIYNQGLFNQDTNGKIVMHGCNSGCYYFQPDPEGDIHCTTLDSDMLDKSIENVDFNPCINFQMTNQKN